MTDARLYAKIMRHLEKATGTGFWDFRTLNQTHPQIADCLYRVLLRAIGNSLRDGRYSDTVILNHYVPRRIWTY